MRVPTAVLVPSEDKRIIPNPVLSHLNGFGAQRPELCVHNYI